MRKKQRGRGFEQPVTSEFTSDAEELLGSVTDPALLPSSASRNARLRADEELICVMIKAVN